jgi:uncharacterized membrane protein (Fun14 family)
MVDITQIGLEAGSGALVGGVIGFAAKKVAKIIAVLVGLELALFKFLETKGILSVDWEALSAGMINATEAAQSNQPPGIVQSLLSAVPVSAGFTGAFMLGFRKG